MNDSSAHTRAEPASSRTKVEPGRAWWVVPVATCAIASMMLASSPVREPPSLRRHLSTGRYIAENGLPASDPFTGLGTNRPWANPAWGFDFAVYLVHFATGDAGMLAARVVLAIALVVVLFVRNESDATAWQPMLIVCGILAIQSGLQLSPGLLALILQAVWFTVIGCLGRWSIGSLAVRVVLLQAIWANVAPTFLLCPLALAFTWLGCALDQWTAGRLQRVPVGHGRYFVAMLATLLGSFANPFGLRACWASWRECFAAFQMSAEGQLIVEGLMPLWSVSKFGAAEICYVVLLAASVIGFVPAIRFRMILPAVFFALLAIADFRHLPLSAVWLIRTAQTSCAERFQAAAATDRSARASGWLSWAGFMVAVVVFLAVASSQLPENLADLRRQHSGTTVAQIRQRWLQHSELAGSALLLDPSQAGWFIGSLSPLRLVLDDRLELFADDYAMYRRFCRDVVHDRHNSYRRTDGSIGGWRRLAASLPFDWIVSRASDLESNMMLSTSTYWAPAYWDAEVVIFGPKQHSAVQTATRRLDELKNVSVFGINGVPELSPNTPETVSLIMEKDAWRTQSQREFLELAGVYFALDRPEIAFYLLSRVDGSKLLKERNALLKRLDEKKAMSEFQ